MCGDSTLVTRVKERAQCNLVVRRLPGGSWPHNPVSNSLGSWEAKMRQRELTPVLQALGGLRGQCTLNLESGVGTSTSVTVAFVKIFYSPGCRGWPQTPDPPASTVPLCHDRCLV